MTGACQRVAIITVGSQGVGASLVAAYRRRDWAVVANSRTSKPSEDGAVPTISKCSPRQAAAASYINGATAN